MDCKQTAIAIESALDAGRTERPPEVAARHLAGCASCRRLWAEARAVEAGLGDWAEADVHLPAGLHGNIMDALQADERRQAARPRILHRPRQLGLAVAAMLLMGFGLHWLALDRVAAPKAGPLASAWSIPSFTLENINFDPAQLFGQPKQDFQELADEILSAAGSLIEMAPATPPGAPERPTPTPYGQAAL